MYEHRFNAITMRIDTTVTCPFVDCPTPKHIRITSQFPDYNYPQPTQIVDGEVKPGKHSLIVIYSCDTDHTFTIRYVDGEPVHVPRGWKPLDK